MAIGIVITVKQDCPYDALTTKRSYSDAQNPYYALRTIRNKMLNKIDQEIFENFIKFLGGSGSLRVK